MSNPHPEEARIIEQIKKEELEIHPLVWELIRHYIGNDVYAIQLIAGSYLMGDTPEPIPVEDARKLLKHCDGIKDFLEKLKNLTDTKKG